VKIANAILYSQPNKKIMMKPSIKRLCLLTITSFLLFSCVSRKEIVYFQGLETAQHQLEDNVAKNVHIQASDLLTINVSASEPDAAIPFNLTVGTMSQNITGMDQLGLQTRPQMQTYHVNKKGQISFPVLGTIKVSGLSAQDLSDKLAGQLSTYIQEPIVNVRLVNFQVSILGEVNRPGTFDVNDDQISLPKALGFAGDLTIYGKRNNVLVVRQEDQKKSYAYLDLTDPETINSPFYYLQQNDVVYIEPNKAQIQSASYNRNATVYISIASVLVSLAVLLTR